VALVSNPRVTFGKHGVLAAQLVVAGSLLVMLLYTVYEWMGLGETGVYTVLSDSTKQLGNLLFDQWGVIVLVFGLVLFAAMMGGVFIAQEEDD
jgi:NADH:ubiquinone oxidoreductase subunit 6 (subunit J)